MLAVAVPGEAGMIRPVFHAAVGNAGLALGAAGRDTGGMEAPPERIRIAEDVVCNGVAQLHASTAAASASAGRMRGPFRKRPSQV